MSEPWIVIDYKIARLAGEMPKHFSVNLDGDLVRAEYFSAAELAEHMSRIYVMAMVRECEALGGFVTGPCRIKCPTYGKT